MNDSPSPGIEGGGVPTGGGVAAAVTTSGGVSGDVADDVVVDVVVTIVVVVTFALADCFWAADLGIFTLAINSGVTARNNNKYAHSAGFEFLPFSEMNMCQGSLWSLDLAFKPLN